jgi:hypothetical protein
LPELKICWEGNVYVVSDMAVRGYCTTALEAAGARGADRRMYIPGGDVAGGGVDLTGDPLEGDWYGDGFVGR